MGKRKGEFCRRMARMYLAAVPSGTPGGVLAYLAVFA